MTPYTRHNVEVGAYLQDRWTPRAGLLIEPGLRFDWDEIVRRPLLSPRLAAVYSPRRAGREHQDLGGRRDCITSTRSWNI